ncbi:MAG: hypothetical protein EOM19_04990 [Candidatus Moranbacteria bacterium]|nr:hypothetical protein [Candidatus Moranbacteria bacterium]
MTDETLRSGDLSDFGGNLFESENTKRDLSTSRNRNFVSIETTRREREVSRLEDSLETTERGEKKKRRRKEEEKIPPNFSSLLRGRVCECGPSEYQPDRVILAREFIWAGIIQFKYF